MARFDVYRSDAGQVLLLDCQADLLSSLATRLVVPLLRPAGAPTPARVLNPMLDVEGERYVMVTQYAATVEVRALGPRIASLADQGHAIMNALDFLLTGA